MLTGLLHTATVDDQGERAHGGSNINTGAASPLFAAAVGLALALAGALYQPWRRVPFDIRDFSEFLPLLQQHHGWLDRLVAFTHYYVTQGRFNVLSYAGLVTKWSLFGTDAAAWEWARFAEMVAIIALAWVVLRRLGLGRWGAAAGASLFIVASSATPAWTRLTMGEPLGCLGLFAATVLATRYRATRAWRRDGVAIALVLALAVLAKEMLLAYVPFVVVVAACLEAPGRLAAPRFDTRLWWLVALVGGALLVVVLPIGLIARAAPHQAFVADYGGASLTTHRALRNVLQTVLPVAPAWASNRALFRVPANAIWCMLAAAAAATLFARGVPWERRQACAFTVLALALPVVGALVYLPWPVFNAFYGLPYLLGPALLLGGAVTVIARRAPAPTGAGVAAVACIGLVVSATALADHDARQSMAWRAVNAGLARYLGASNTLSPVLVMDPYPATQRWQGTGATLGRYADALYGASNARRFGDTTCVAPTAPADGPPALFVTYSDLCGTFRRPTAAFRQGYRYLWLDWHGPRIRRDSLRADVCVVPGDCDPGTRDAEVSGAPDP